MYILNQNKTALINSKNILAIEKYLDNTIEARCVTGGAYKIGHYNSQERTEEVFEEIVKQLGDTEKYLVTTDVMLKNEDLVKETERLEKLYGTDIILSDMRYNITPIKSSEKIYIMPEE